MGRSGSRTAASSGEKLLRAARPSRQPLTETREELHGCRWGDDEARDHDAARARAEGAARPFSSSMTPARIADGEHERAFDTHSRVCPAGIVSSVARRRRCARGSTSAPTCARDEAIGPAPAGAWSRRRGRWRAWGAGSRSPGGRARGRRRRGRRRAGGAPVSRAARASSACRRPGARAGRGVAAVPGGDRVADDPDAERPRGAGRPRGDSLGAAVSRQDWSASVDREQRRAEHDQEDETDEHGPAPVSPARRAPARPATAAGGVRRVWPS